MAKYKLKEGVVCHPFGPANKQVVNKLSKDEKEAETQMQLTDPLAEFLLESERLTLDQFEVTEAKGSKELPKE